MEAAILMRCADVENVELALMCHSSAVPNCNPPRTVGYCTRFGHSVSNGMSVQQGLNTFSLYSNII